MPRRDIDYAEERIRHAFRIRMNSAEAIINACLVALAVSFAGLLTWGAIVGAALLLWR